MAVLQLLFAGSLPRVQLAGLDPMQTQVSPTDATATYVLSSGGLEQATGQTDATWLLQGAAADYEARATVVSGALTSGTTASWLGLGTTRSWTVTRTNNLPGLDECVLTMEIRAVATGTVLTSATVTLSAEVTL